MFNVVFLAFLGLFIAIQGGLIFTTAYLGLRTTRHSGTVAKIAAMVLSGLVWLVVAVVAYGLFGGSGGIEAGFSALLFSIATASASAVFYLIAWILWPASEDSQG